MTIGHHNNGRSGSGLVNARKRVSGILFFALLGAPAISTEVRADEFDDASKKLVDLDERIRQLAADFKDAPPPDPHAADRRVVEAQTLFELKQYPEAATLLLDVVERYPDTRAYDDAIVLLGDALYQNHDLISARRYLELAVKKNTGSKREQQALNRLIEISLKTGDYDNIDEYLSRLQKIPLEAQDPSVPYVRGKYFFFRDKLEESAQAFTAVGPNNPYYLQARYFLATVDVKRGDLASALTGFDAVIQAPKKTDADREIEDLARLAIGRILYDRGQFDKARESYAAIRTQSKYFVDANYELAWNAIKAKDFKRAYQYLDLMLLQAPDSPRAPELRLLMGNLNLRLSNFFLASETFSKTRDEFEPLHKQLTTTVTQSQNDPRYFDNLLGSNIEKFDISLVVPKEAVKWVKDDHEVAKMLSLVTDVGELRKGIKEAEDLLGRLDRAVNGQGKVGIFPDLRDTRTRSEEVLNSTLSIRQKFAPRARALATPFLSAEEKAQLDQNAAQRGAFEQTLKDLPTTADGLKKRDQDTRGRLEALDKQASELNVQIHALEAELVAIEQYFVTSKSDQKIRPEDLTQPVTELKGLLGELRKAHEQVRGEIAEAGRDVSVGGAAAEVERSHVVQLAALMKSEHDILQKARGRMSNVGEFDSISNLLARADAVQSKVVEFDDRVDRAAEGRLAGIKDKLVTEKTNLETAAAKLTGIVSESSDLGGGLASATLRKVTDRFYEIVVQSDVGLVDVAWGLKDQKTQNLSKLINQQKLELKAVEDDFRVLLQEEDK